jgi:hypothetical protein
VLAAAFPLDQRRLEGHAELEAMMVHRMAPYAAFSKAAAGSVIGDGGDAGVELPASAGG